MNSEKVCQMTIDYCLKGINDLTKYNCNLDSYRTKKEPFIVNIWEKNNKGNVFCIAVEPSMAGSHKFFDFYKSLKEKNDITEPYKEYYDWFCGRLCLGEKDERENYY